jgi:hypothetical protein
MFELLHHCMFVFFIAANYLTPILQLPRSHTTKLNNMVNINVSQVGLGEIDQRKEYFTVYFLLLTIFMSATAGNPLTLELNPSVQRCLTRLLLGILLLEPCISLILCVKNQQIQQLFIQFINYVW